MDYALHWPLHKEEHDIQRRATWVPYDKLLSRNGPQEFLLPQSARFFLRHRDGSPVFVRAEANS